jgi:hypothetical protein
MVAMPAARLPACPFSRVSLRSQIPAYVVDSGPHPKRELLKLCARIGYAPH